MFSQLQFKPCQAPLWAKGGHLQTLWNFCLPDPKAVIASETHHVRLPDGDQLALLYTPGSSEWVIYLFHGLTGAASSNYMERTARLCISRNHSVYRVNHRGCGEGMGLAQFPYHSGRGEDVSEVIALGRKRHPHKRHIAVGFSLGGNALLNLLTGQRGHVLPDYALSVNAPIDLAAAALKLQEGVNRIYDLYFVNCLRQTVLQQYHAKHISQKLSISRLATLKMFDALYTAPVCGFKSVEDYYHTCSTHQHLTKITVPTILLTSNDDPFVPVASYQQASVSPSTHLHIEPVGGHLGYLSYLKTPLGHYRWLDYALLECFQALTQQQF